MKTIMYELLGMVKKGNTPKIKFNNNIYEYHGKGYGYCRYHQNNNYISLDTDYCLFDILNDEVEILEEEPYVEICGKWFTKSEFDEFIKSKEEKKIPEKLDWNRNNFTYPEGNLMSEETADMLMEIQDKVNLILDYLKSKESK